MESKSSGTVNIKRMTGDEPFHLNGQAVKISTLNFWQWSSSDLLGNTLRGLLAEFIVGLALNIVDGVRQEWHLCDLETHDGKKIEVKSAAYLQSWPQTRLSNIRFNIAPALGWDAKTNEYATERKRQADIYVFALLEHQDKSTVDPLNLNQWSFYVVGTDRLNTEVPHQNTISLSKLKSIIGRQVSFSELKSAIEQL